MTARVSSVALVGMEARPVEVEVDISSHGLPDIQIVGLPSAAVREARQRVKAALAMSNEEVPSRRVTVNLAPGDLRKEGALLDLPIAVAMVLAKGSLQADLVARYLFVGELALDGRLRPVRGALAAALAARDIGAEGMVLPKANASEAALVPGIKVIGAQTLAEALAFAAGDLSAVAERPDAERLLSQAAEGGPDLSEVKGQALARRALEIAAAGGHHLFMVGPPGAGKTMLARRLPAILPPLSVEEALEVTRVWSVAGMLVPGQPIIARRPFRSPHHQASAAAIVGGGSPMPRPGEVSLAHHGVLFLDELPLFSRAVLEGLRQPVEDGIVTVARHGGTVQFPSKVSLVGAANPCFCGKLGDRPGSCRCMPGRVEAYRSRLSGPLLDRFDLHVELPRLTESELLALGESESSASVRERVIGARRRRDARTEAEGTLRTGGNKHGNHALERSLSSTCRNFLRGALSIEPSSGRGFTRMIGVARTIADLEGSDEIEEQHLAEALHFRRIVWES